MYVMVKHALTGIGEDVFETCICIMLTIKTFAKMYSKIVYIYIIHFNFCTKNSKTT